MYKSQRTAGALGFLLQHSLLMAVAHNVTLNFILKKIIYYLFRPLNPAVLVTIQEQRTAISLNFILFKKIRPTHLTITLLRRKTHLSILWHLLWPRLFQSKSLYILVLLIDFVLVLVGDCIKYILMLKLFRS